jgi:hypothetical protein
MTVKHYLYKLLIMIKGRRLKSSIMYKPFFIIGSGRSGTTLLRAILQTHPEVHIPPETYVLGRVIKNYKRYSRLPWRVLLIIILAEFEYHPEFGTFGISLRKLYHKLKACLPEEQNLAHVLNSIYMFHANTVTPSAARWGDKTPMNTFYLDRILSVFPNALFIHMIRDGRDVVKSMLEAGRYKTIHEAAARWIRSVQIARDFGKKYQGNYYEIKYEDLVKAPKDKIQVICNFLGLEFVGSMLRHHENQSTLTDIDKYSHLSNVKAPISTASVGKWRKYFNTRKIEELYDRMGPMLESLDYKR